MHLAKPLRYGKLRVPETDTGILPLVRRADPEDAWALAALFRSTYGDTSHPCQEGDHIRQGIVSGNELWWVAECDSRIVGCMCVIRHRWNLSAELGRAIVHPSFRNSRLVLRLLQICAENLYLDGSELAFLSPRSRTSFILANRAKGFRFTPVGHDGAMNTANGLREYHLIAIAARPAAPFFHVTPANCGLSSSSYVRDSVYAPLGLRPMPGPYPEVFFAGPRRIECNSRFHYSVDRPAGALMLTGYDGPARGEKDVIRHLQTFLASHHGFGHVSAQVLADKTELIQRMVNMEFEVTAYLPAWCKFGPCRYDCVMLVKRGFAERPECNGLDAYVESLDVAHSLLAPQFADAARACA